MADDTPDLPDKLPCFLNDSARAEYAALQEGPAKAAVYRALNRGFPWYSVDFGPITRVKNLIEWNVANPDAIDLPLDLGDDTDVSPPDVSPLGYRIYGVIEVERSEDRDKAAESWFKVTGIRETIRRYRFEPAN